MTTLAAVLVVRNEARCIEQCLESLRPWVDRIIVLDTWPWSNASWPR